MTLSLTLGGLLSELLFFRISASYQKQQLVLLPYFNVFYKLKYFPQLFWRHIGDIKRDPNLYFQWVFNIRKVGELCLLNGLVSYMKFSWQYFHCLEQSGQLYEEIGFSL